MSDQATSLSVGTFGWGVEFDVENYTEAVGVFGWSGAAAVAAPAGDAENAPFFGMEF